MPYTIVKKRLVDICTNVDLLFKGKAPRLITQPDIDRIVSRALANGKPEQAEMCVNDERVMLQKNIKNKKKLLFKVKRKHIAQYRDVPEADRLMMIRRMKMGKHLVFIIRFKSEDSFNEMKRALQMVSSLPFPEDAQSTPPNRSVQTETEPVYIEIIPHTSPIIKTEEYRQQRDSHQIYKTEQPIYLLKNNSSTTISKISQKEKPVYINRNLRSSPQKHHSSCSQSGTQTEQSSTIRICRRNPSPVNQVPYRANADIQHPIEVHQVSTEQRSSRVQRQQCYQSDHPIYQYKKPESLEGQTVPKAHNHRKHQRRARSQNLCLTPRQMYFVKRVHFPADQKVESEVDRVTIYDCCSVTDNRSLREHHRSYSSVSGSSVSSSDYINSIPIY